MSNKNALIDTLSDKELKLVAGVHALEECMLDMPEEDHIDLYNAAVHHFAPGVYMRELTLPAGSVCTGRIHKTTFLNVIAQGSVAVSSVDGDANVAGVFVNWDNDDDVYTNDMNIAMTGDMVIRIAQGTTVARGDLLMSAGDGTAKPQGDDIVRSKTIAKVTSTNVSHTYDDGTYLVPCVLMAC